MHLLRRAVTYQRTAVSIVVGVVVVVVVWTLAHGRANEQRSNPKSILVDAASSRRTPTRLFESRPSRRGGAAHEPAPNQQQENALWEVHLANGDGLPLEGVRFSAFATSSVTDAQGVARFPAHETEVFCGAMGRGFSLREPVTEIAWRDGVVVTASFVDLETLNPIAVSTAGIQGETAQIGWVSPGAVARTEFPIEAPEGWISIEGPVGLGRTSRYATAFRVTMPIPRELVLPVRVTDTAGSPLPGVEVTASVECFQGAYRTVAETDASGCAELRGLPFIRGDAIVVSVDNAGHVETRQVVMRGAHRRLERLDFVWGDQVIARAEPSRPWSGLAVGGGRRPELADEAPATLTVVGVRRDGAPASGSKVQLDGPESLSITLGADGVGVAESVAAGDYTAWLLEPGLAPTSLRISLVPGQVERAQLNESAGREILVRVLDDLGQAVAGAWVFARLDRPDWVHAQLEADTQVLQPRTDGNGEIRIARVPPGATVRAIFGSRIADAVLEDADVLEVRLPACESEH